MKNTKLLLCALLLVGTLLLLQACSSFHMTAPTDSSPITISDDKIHFHQRPGGFNASSKTTIAADETNEVAQRFIVRNCSTLPCYVDLTPGKNSWSATLLDANGNTLDTISASSTAATVTDKAGDAGFVTDAPDNTTGPGYYHDPPSSGGAHILVDSVMVTVNGQATSLQCPPTNCFMVAQYFNQDWVHAENNDWGCRPKK